MEIWKKTNRNMGLAVDVHDQDENPLMASSFFYPSDCQACKCDVSAFS